MSSYNQFRPAVSSQNSTILPTAPLSTALAELISGTTTVFDVPVNCTSIQEAFWQSWNKATLTTINSTVPVVTIGASAFKGCTGLTEINLDSAVTIDENAFEACVALTAVNASTVNTTYKGKWAKAESQAIYRCEGGGYYSNEPTLAAIGYYLEVSSRYRETIDQLDWSAYNITTAPHVLDSTDASSFYTCLLGDDNSADTEHTALDVDPLAIVTIAGTGRTSIVVRKYAFSGCTALATFPFSQVTSVGNYSFQDCKALTTVNISNCNFSMYCFRGCTELTSVSSTGEAWIGERAFSDCTKLATISFNSVTSLYTHCFSNCSKLTSVTLDTITTIGGPYCFNQCTGLTTISLQNLGTAATVPSGHVNGISAYMFNACSLLAHVNAPHIKSISERGFNGCTALTSIGGESSSAVFDEVITIGTSAFYGCTSLTAVSLPECTSIGSEAFRNCTALASVSLPKLTTISGTDVFQACTALTAIDLPELTSCSIQAFRYSSLQVANLPKLTVTTAAIFTNITSLTQVTLGSLGFPVTTLYKDTFYGCTQATLTITLYIDPENPLTIPTTKWRATNATIVKKSSVDGSDIA